MTDQVVHPDHYNLHPSGVECWDVVEWMPFNVGAAVKHLWRAGLKPGHSTVTDLQKAMQYVVREIERLRKIDAEFSNAQPAAAEDEPTDQGDPMPVEHWVFDPGDAAPRLQTCTCDMSKPPRPYVFHLAEPPVSPHALDRCNCDFCRGRRERPVGDDPGVTAFLRAGHRG